MLDRLEIAERGPVLGIEPQRSLKRRARLGWTVPVREDSAVDHVRDGELGVPLEPAADRLERAVQVAGLPVGLGQMREEASLGVRGGQEFESADFVPVRPGHVRDGDLEGRERSDVAA